MRLLLLLCFDVKQFIQGTPSQLPLAMANQKAKIPIISIVRK
jgi:hypothetical protein